MIRAWQQLPNTSREGRLFDVDIPVPQFSLSSRVSVSSAVIARPQGYELDRKYVDNDFFQYLFYLSPEGGNKATEDINDRYGFGYVEVYVKKSGSCPERPAFVYVADTPQDYVELVTYVAALGGVRWRPDPDFDY